MLLLPESNESSRLQAGCKLFFKLLNTCANFRLESKTFHLRAGNPPLPVCAMLPDRQLEDLRASLWRTPTGIEASVLTFIARKQGT